MTEKRFTLVDEYLISYDGDYFDLHKPSDIRSLVNVIGYVTDENEQLKQQLKTKCIVNKQYEENQRLIKMLDNVANYMQKQHKDMPIDDFVEWWNGIATKGLDDGDVE